MSQKAKTALAPPMRPVWSISWRAALVLTSFWVSLAKLVCRAGVMGSKFVG
jgi:hypothetical protein